MSEQDAAAGAATATAANPDAAAEKAQWSAQRADLRRVTMNNRLASLQRRRDTLLRELDDMEEDFRAEHRHNLRRMEQLSADEETMTEQIMSLREEIDDMRVDYQHVYAAIKDEIHHELRQRQQVVAALHRAIREAEEPDDEIREEIRRVRAQLEIVNRKRKAMRAATRFKVAAATTKHNQALEIELGCMEDTIIRELHDGLQGTVSGDILEQNAQMEVELAHNAHLLNKERETARSLQETLTEKKRELAQATASNAELMLKLTKMRAFLKTIPPMSGEGATAAATAEKKTTAVVMKPVPPASSSKHGHVSSDVTKKKGRSTRQRRARITAAETEATKAVPIAVAVDRKKDKRRKAALASFRRQRWGNGRPARRTIKGFSAEHQASVLPGRLLRRRLGKRRIMRRRVYGGGGREETSSTTGVHVNLHVGAATATPRFGRPLE